MAMIKFTGYARFAFIIFAVLILIGSFTTPGVQWFASGFGGWLLGVGLLGKVPRFVKDTTQMHVEIRHDPALPVIDTKEVKWNSGR